METIPAFEVPRSARYEEIVVPSVDSARLVYAFQLLVLNNKHVLCPGPTGTGKSVNISMWMQKQAPDNFQGIFVNFSAQTHVNQFQDMFFFSQFDFVYPFVVPAASDLDSDILRQ